MLLLQLELENFELEFSPYKFACPTNGVIQIVSSHAYYENITFSHVHNSSHMRLPGDACAVAPCFMRMLSKILIPS